MAKRDRFPHEAETAPGNRSTSGPAPKRKRSDDAPTLPPPAPRSRAKTHRSAHQAARPETSQKTPASKKPKSRAENPGATVDAVIADLSKDPRRDED